MVNGDGSYGGAAAFVDPADGLRPPRAEDPAADRDAPPAFAGAREGARPAVRGSARVPERELARGGGADVFPGMCERYRFCPTIPICHTDGSTRAGSGRACLRGFGPGLLGHCPVAHRPGAVQRWRRKEPEMSTSEPGEFTERGDRAEAAAYRGDGVYSGGQFAGGDAERYDRLSGADPGEAELSRDDDEGAASRDVESRGLLHPSLGQNATGAGPHADRG